MTTARTSFPRAAGEPRERPASSAWTDAERAHLLLRLVLGINIAAHGLVRVGHPLRFAETMAADFANTPVPAPLSFAFLATLPFVELTVGLFVLLGVRLRDALTVGGLVIAALTFGSCMKEAWELAGMQLVYALGYYLLLSRAGDARLTLTKHQA